MPTASRARRAVAGDRGAKRPLHRSARRVCVGSVGLRRPMAGMRGSGADVAPCHQHGAQSARHEHVSKDAPVTRYAVMFQYEVPFTRRLFLGALFPVWPIQHPACSAFTLRSACRPLHWPVIPQPKGRGLKPPTVFSIGRRSAWVSSRNAPRSKTEASRTRRRVCRLRGKRIALYCRFGIGTGDGNGPCGPRGGLMRPSGAPVESSGFPGS